MLVIEGVGVRVTVAVGLGVNVKVAVAVGNAVRVAGEVGVGASVLVGRMITVGVGTGGNELPQMLGIPAHAVRMKARRKTVRRFRERTPRRIVSVLFL